MSECQLYIIIPITFPRQKCKSCQTKCVYAYHFKRFTLYIVELFRVINTMPGGQ